MLIVGMVVMADEQDKKHGTEQQVTEQLEGQPETKTTINWHYVAFGIGSLIGLIMVVQDYGFSRSSLTYWRNFGIGIVALFAVILLIRWFWRKLVKWAGEQSEADEVEGETVVAEQTVKSEKPAVVEPSNSPKVLVDNQHSVIDKSTVNWRYRKF
jgi:uncharacterized membrane protein YcjF (UPF0283 family)